MKLRIGIVGGTFDPIHLGHLALAEAARECAGLDRIVFIPAGDPPHRADAIASAEDRLAMCRLAVAGRPGFEVLDLEVRRPGPSYTLETVMELVRQEPEADYFLVLGWDAARDIQLWRGPDSIMRLVRLVIISRPGWPPPLPPDLERAGIDPGRAVLCRTSTPDIEATDIRRRLELGETLSGLLDARVADYLRRHHLYPLKSA
ncbi:MAG TPA: nicotinate-nucleotide adenylyltransferase [Candidatus Acidoferrales bacterium]|nr:nicotinate-nucleotide adenylyltransferase [Candidatus Acidoferrales bacterium]